MLRVVWSQLRRRTGRAAVLLFGIVVAATSFIVLTGAVETSRLETVGTVEEHFRGQYDLLVRPPGSQSELERDAGLVRANHLSGIYGGISQEEYETIADLPGVDVAAPIGVIGYFAETASIHLDLTDHVYPDERTILRIDRTRITDSGLTRIPDGAPSYLYVTPQPTTTVEEPIGDGDFFNVIPVENLTSGEDRVLDTWHDEGTATTFPSARTTPDTGTFSTATGAPVPDGLEDVAWDPLGEGRVPYEVSFVFPFLVAAIDPEAEAQLAGVQDAMVEGDYFGPGAEAAVQDLALTADERFGEPAEEIVPVVLASRPYVDNADEYVISRLPQPLAERVPDADDPEELFADLADADAGELDRTVVDSADAYDQLFHRRWQEEGVAFIYPQSRFWRAGDVTYDSHGERVVAAEPVRNDADVWRSPPLHEEDPGAFSGPDAAADVHFRPLDVVDAPREEDEPVPNRVQFLPVGSFDPELLTGFDELTELPMETYHPPTATGADDRSAELLGGEPLLPNDNPGGYLQAPPLMLTTFDGADKIATQFDRTDDRLGTAPISVVRVRVSGVTGPDPVSRERVSQVAGDIVERTGLEVDFTLGSSPSPVTVELPAGEFGRPGLTLAEQWANKGVAYRILDEADRKSLLLFGLILAVCALFVFNAAAAAVRTRRQQLGVLACLGWSRWRLFGTVLLEMGVIGLLAGGAAAALAVPVADWLGLATSRDQALLAVPAAMLLAVVAGLIPAWRASRTAPIDAVRPPARQPRRPYSPRGLTTLALTGLARSPGRTALGAAGLMIGVGALTVLLAVSYGFQGRVVGSLLGDAIVVQARTADYAAAAAMLALSAIAIADILYLETRDRDTELATLRSFGWPRGTLTRMIVIEGMGLGAIGALAGATTGVLAATYLSGSLPAAAMPPIAAATIGAVVLAALAATVPALVAARTNITELLSQE
ncbi:MAG: FtsX-like permease family protein [Actinomycetota bacterium]